MRHQNSSPGSLAPEFIAETSSQAGTGARFAFDVIHSFLILLDLL